MRVFEEITLIQELAHRALTLGYYWPTMKQDTQEIVQKYDRSQRFGKYTHQPPMTPIQVFWPFVQWGVDIIGPLPATKANNKFVVIAMDYCTKWVEAKALVKIGQSEIEEFHLYGHCL